MKIDLSAEVHFDGTTLAIEIWQMFNAENGETFLGNTDPGARVIEFLRAKGLDVYDRRQEYAAPEPADPVYPPPDDPSHGHEPGGVIGNRIYPEPIQSHHVKHDQGGTGGTIKVDLSKEETPKTKAFLAAEEIKL